jgi:hypothetical protein
MRLRLCKGSRSEQFKAAAVAAVPIRRFLEADEIAELVVLCRLLMRSGHHRTAMNIAAVDHVCERAVH